MKTLYTTLQSVLLASALLIGLHPHVYAQEQTDTLEVKSNKISTEISLGKTDSKSPKVKYPRTYGGITFSRIDWGFSRLLDDGSFNLSDDNRDLAYSRASNFGFDVAQFGLRFNDKFKVYLSTGFEWNYLRFKENILLDENTSSFSYEIIDRNDIHYTKNVFTSTYLRVPLTFEIRSNPNSNGKRVKFAFGPMTGILLKGTQRLKSKENGKQKFKDNYNLQSFQYGAFARLGFGSMGVFGKYYVNDFFEKSPNQKGLHNLAFGATLGF